jgi:hypothetical protein
MHDTPPAFETHLEMSFPYDILTVHPLEFARQATLVEWEIFRSIKPGELITLGWMRKDDSRHKLSPNIIRYQRYMTALKPYYYYYYY